MDRIGHFDGIWHSIGVEIRRVRELSMNITRFKHSPIISLRVWLFSVSSRKCVTDGRMDGTRSNTLFSTDEDPHLKMQMLLEAISL